MGVPALKPIRIPTSIGEEDKEFLAKKRTSQNASYQLTILFLDLLRKNAELRGVEKLSKTAFHIAHRYVFPPEEAKVTTQNQHIDATGITTNGV